MEFEDQDEDERPSYHTSPSTPTKLTKYKECLKNHALSIGGHAVDGCGEFIPSSDDSLKCAACNCHRSFHRKDNFVGSGGFAFQHFTSYHHHHHHHRGYLQAQQHHHQRPTPLLALPSTSGGGGGGGGGEMEEYMGGRKRYRTKFTAEQKEKMVKVAGRVGWRIQKADEEMVDEFCREMGIKRQVFKVWMHNNKHTLSAHSAANKTLEINTTNDNDNDNDNPTFPN